MSKAEQPQFKVLLPPDVQQKLDVQRVALGFHTPNALSSVYLSALADVPSSKVWQVLALIRRHQQPDTKKSVPQSSRKSLGC